jgi:hypothetical protein
MDSRSGIGVDLVQTGPNRGAVLDPALWLAKEINGFAPSGKRAAEEGT